MPSFKTKAIEALESKIGQAGMEPLRQEVLQSAKNFKTSWIELGRSLYTVWKDKRYKEWGFTTFDAYTCREIGIRKETSMKLLRSYFFLEKEEPDYLRTGYQQQADAPALPTYEAIDVLRRAKSKRELDKQDYEDLRDAIFSKGKDARQAQQDLTQLIRQRQELEPEEAREKKKSAMVRRMMGLLRSLAEELRDQKLLSVAVLKETQRLIERLEAEIQ